MKSLSLAVLGAVNGAVSVEAASLGVAVGEGEDLGAAGDSWATKPNGKNAQKRSVGIYRIWKKRKAARLKIHQF